MVYSERLFMAVKCQIAPASFSGERVFTIKLANEQPYTSLAPRHFFWNSSRHIVSVNEPNEKVEGYVAARVVEELDENQFLVEVPDGEIVAIDKSDLVGRPTPIQPAIEV
jgi:hypothetical protein